MSAGAGERRTAAKKRNTQGRARTHQVEDEGVQARAEADRGEDAQHDPEKRLVALVHRSEDSLPRATGLREAEPNAESTADAVGGPAKRSARTGFVEW